MTHPPTERQLEALEKAIQERALRLCDLEVIIYDYHRERQRLLEEIIELKQQLWDLVGDRHSTEHEPWNAEDDAVGDP